MEGLHGVWFTTPAAANVAAVCPASDPSAVGFYFKDVAARGDGSAEGGYVFSLKTGSVRTVLPNPTYRTLNIGCS